MELACGYKANHGIRKKQLKNENFRRNSDALLVLKLPSSLALQAISRSLFLALLILAVPSIRSILRGSPSYIYDDSDPIGSYSYPISFDFLPLLLRDLADDGLLRKGGKALILSPGVFNSVDYSEFFHENEIVLEIESDLESKSLIPDETFDFILTLSSGSAEFVDRVLKVGGLFVTQLSDDPTTNAFQQPPNYKIAYLRQFEATVVAMRKMSLTDETTNSNSPTKLHLCGGKLEAKRSALMKGLEDVLLEPPPRRALDYLKKTKFLPNLLGDSLESYRRRVLIIDDDNGGAEEWFYQNYPTRNQHFEVYNLGIEVYDMDDVNEFSMMRRKKMLKVSRISDWLMKNVREEEFVVVKAEAQAVEEMVRERTICLVDELFLECKSQWEEEEEKERNESSKKAYWECLALYGRLRDEGVAVHQWWG